MTKKKYVVYEMRGMNVVINVNNKHLNLCTKTHETCFNRTLFNYIQKVYNHPDAKKIISFQKQVRYTNLYCPLVHICKS